MAQNRLSRLPASLRVTFQSLPFWWDDWVGQVVLGIVWLLSWVTIILGPPATFGLYHVENRLVRGESLGLRGLVDGARKYFLKSWLWMLANIVVVGLTLNGVWFYGQIEASWGVALRVVMLAILFTWVLVQFYALPFLIIQEKESLRLAWRNGLFTFMAAPGYSLVIYVVTALAIALSVLFIIPLFLGFIPFTVVLFSLAVKERVETFRAIMQKQNEKEEEKQE